MSESRGAVTIARQYAVRPRLEAWELPEGPVPESVPHDHAAEHLRRERERAEKERERAARLDLERRVAELEALRSK